MGEGKKQQHNSGSSNTEARITFVQHSLMSRHTSIRLTEGVMAQSCTIELIWMKLISSRTYCSI